MSKELFPLYRHGDVLVQRIGALPHDARPINGLVLAYGEATGHSHRIAELDGRAALLRNVEGLFLEIVDDPATLVHDEHGPISLEPGIYRVWKQREYLPGADPSGKVRFVPVSD